MTLKNSTGRRRGGQPGNKNNLRHGFYAALYTIEETKRLKSSNIEDEQDLARTKAYRLAELTPLRTNTQVSELELLTLDRLTGMLISINTIERTRMLERGRGGAIGDTIMQALLEMNPDEDLE